MDKSEFVIRQKLLIREYTEKIGKELKLCDKCEGVIEFDNIPKSIAHHFMPCVCIKCSSCKNLIKTELQYDEDALCTGYKCEECQKENCTGFSDLELNALSKEE